jgi:hypothetical protein
LFLKPRSENSSERGKKKSLLEPTLLVCAGYLAAANQKLQCRFLKFRLLPQSTPSTSSKAKLLGDILCTRCPGNMVADFKDLEVLGATL